MPGVPPVPISNTAVKPRAANGSRTIGPARVGRCQVYSPALRKKSRASFFISDGGQGVIPTLRLFWTFPSGAPSPSGPGSQGYLQAGTQAGSENRPHLGIVKILRDVGIIRTASDLCYAMSSTACGRHNFAALFHAPHGACSRHATPANTIPCSNPTSAV